MCTRIGSRFQPTQATVSALLYQTQFWLPHAFMVSNNVGHVLVRTKLTLNAYVCMYVYFRGFAILTTYLVPRGGGG